MTGAGVHATAGLRIERQDYAVNAGQWTVATRAWPDSNGAIELAPRTVRPPAVVRLGDVAPTDARARRFVVAFGAALRECRERFWTLASEALRSEDVELSLGVERDIVVRVAPRTTRRVRVRVRRTERATPRVVWDPEPGE